MDTELKVTIKNISEILPYLPPKEQGYLLGRMEGYKFGYEDAQKEKRNKISC